MTQPLKIVFAGTPEIAKTTLETIIAAGFKVAMALTQPDRPAGRGQKLMPSPVKMVALKHAIPLLQPISLKREPEVIEAIRALAPDIIIVLAYGLMIPQALLDIPRLGCVNIHVSLLPRWRGAAPIQRAIMAGDKNTGVTIMQMDAGLDTGNILLQHEIAITDEDTSGSLQFKLTNLGADLIIKYLNNYTTIKSYPQAVLGSNYANKIDKSEARINWSEDALSISYKIRAFNPNPGCFTTLDNKIIKIWQANPIISWLNDGPQGAILKVNKNSLIVSCGINQAIEITELQEAGKARQDAGVYILGHPDISGKVLT